MNKQHSEAFREQALRKVLDRGSKTISEVADALGLKTGTLKNWMKSARQQGGIGSAALPTAANASAAERLDWLLASAAQPVDQLHAWCRERGIYAHQLVAWKAAFLHTAESSGVTPLRHERDALKHERDGLQRQLLRKDKALAEAAALLVLSKKFQALLAGEVA